MTGSNMAQHGMRVFEFNVPKRLSLKVARFSAKHLVQQGELL